MKNKVIRDAILKLQKKYFEQYNISMLEEINNGHCIEFAEELIHILFGKETKNAYCVDISNFMMGVDSDPHKNEIFDEKLLYGYWNIVVPEEFKIPNLFHSGSHCWVVINKRFYDAECPEGVDDFFKLPWFIRNQKINKF